MNKSNFITTAKCVDHYKFWCIFTIKVFVVLFYSYFLKENLSILSLLT